MKKLSFLFTIAALIFSLNVSADGTQCSTIAELKALADGTVCEYVGTATTTYYYDNLGVVMQDETGAILLYNKYLGAAKAGTDEIIKTTVNMQITDVWGTFKKEGGSLIDRIVMSDEDAEWIEIKNSSATFTPEVVDFDTYMTKLDQYKGVAVIFNEINIRSVGESLHSEFYSPTTGATLYVPFDNRIGNMPVKASVSGFLGRDANGRNIFKVGSKEDVKPLSFKAIKDIKNIVFKYEENLNYDLLDTFAVSHVIKEAAKTIVYIQEKDSYEPNHYDLGLRIEVPSVVNINAGDYIAGLYGKFRPFAGDSISGLRGASFFQNANSQIKVVGTGASCRALAKYIYTLNSDGMQNAFRYESTLVVFSGGKVVKNSDATYSYVIENENGTGRQSVRFVVTGVDDLSVYEGKECGVRGIVDVANNYPDNQFTIICRGASDVIESVIKFENIKDLIASGELGTNIVYELVNPVLVTYTFAKTQETPTYYFVVQDETAGIVVDLNVTPMETIQVGDSIVGLKGIYNNTRGITTDFLAVNEELRKDIVVKNSNNQVNGIEVTFAEILADKKLYENRVVTVRGVKKGSVFHSGTDYMPQDAVEGCFVQGTDTIYYTTGANAGNFTLYDYMDITGVVDNKVIGEYYSIWPLSQEHIIDLGTDPTKVDNVVMNANIYSADNTIYVETVAGAQIRVFNLQGQSLYQTIVADALTTICNIAEPVVIIMVDNVAYKLIVK
jgi:hypothetical protein